MVDFTNTAYNTQFIRIKTSSTPAVQVANEAGWGNGSLSQSLADPSALTSSMILD
jgi:hypothetical protein